MTSELSELSDGVVDVAICGGGMAGLLLALQLRRELPSLEIAVFERTPRPLPDARHKVGESSVEMGSQYLERLGLGRYLERHHLIKFALRFFPGGGTRPLEARTEIGPNGEPVVRSYQIDRGRFESDVREMVIEAGAHLFEGVVVRDVALEPGETPHALVVAAGAGDGDATTVRARWVVDATGRAGLIRRRKKLKRGVRHPACAGWFRIAGRLDVNALVPEEAEAWHARPYGGERWRSTNHFMGDGYWAWLIPLSTGHTSVGLVVHDEVHGFDDVRSLERVKAFLAEREPVLARAVEDYEVLDFMCIKGYSHNVARGWSRDGWALVGEAGAFVDPLYSPGTDFIALANAFTGELIKRDLRGEDITDKARSLNLTYRSLVSGAIDIFRQSAPVYGHARAMAAKIYWDNYSYWSFPCQYFQQRIYELPVAEHDRFSAVGARFVAMSNRVQSLMRAWAQLQPMSCGAAQFVAMPAFPSLLVDTHLALQESLTPDETLAMMERRAREGEEVIRELVLRVVQEIGPALAPALLERVGFADWGVAIDEGRLELERLKGLTRRHRLSLIARDVERTLGPVARHEDAEAAREVLRASSAAA